MPSHSRIVRPASALLIAMFLGLHARSAEMQMQVTDNGYLNAQGFSAMLYQSVYHPVFVDQKNAALELILHGQRIATNGDVRMLPTPEQWDLVAHLKDTHADKEHDRLTAHLSFPSYEMDYTLNVDAEPGGIRVSINLDKPLPAKLAGRAGFNLEFLPSIYMDKSYSVDDKAFGIIPRSPQDSMKVVLPPADDPKKLPYQEEWDREKGYTQPLPIVTGNSITLAPEDPLYRVSVSSETAPVSLYDGRNRAQNGWFVLRSLIPAGKTEGAIVWHIHPVNIPNWTRPPMIAHSQAGYPPQFPKVAIIELDPRFDAPKTAKLLRLTEDGSYKADFRGACLYAHAVAALPLRQLRLFAGEGTRPLRYRVRRSAHRALSPSRRMFTVAPGNQASTDFSAWRWITSPCAKAIACGTGFRILTMRARLRQT